MAGENPLGPDEQAQRVSQASPDVAPEGDPLEPESTGPGSGAPAWLLLGVALLIVFAVLLLYAIVLPAIT
jgi:hypothetical protein